MPEKKKELTPEEAAELVAAAETRVPVEDRPVNPDANDGGYQHQEGHGYTEAELAERAASAAK